ncbi:MAG: mucoidy inhibitor MuiA family protein, partial [Alphaproteobacteria bacterium]
MKKLLIAAVIFSLAGISSGRAQEMAQDEQQAEGVAETVTQQAPAAAAVDPFAKMIVAKSEINAVTVYNDRAKVTRVAEIDVPAGAHTVAFKDLPASLMADSLRAEGSARASVTLGAIVSKQIMTARLSSAKEQDLHDRIQVLGDMKNPIESEKAALAAQEKFLKNIGEQAALRNNENLAQIDLKPEQWTSAAQAIHNGLAEVYKAREQQDIKLRDINLEISRLQRELSQISTGQRSIFTVLVPVESDKATKLTLQISYQMPNASWKPIYDARATTEGKGSLKLVQYGAVAQRTGE